MSLCACAQVLACASACVRKCVRACKRKCVRACASACVRACVRKCVSFHEPVRVRAPRAAGERADDDAHCARQQRQVADDLTAEVRRKRLRAHACVRDSVCVPNVCF
jgi:hypothetical protein